MQEGGAEEGAKKKVSAPADINNQVYISYTCVNIHMYQIQDRLIQGDQGGDRYRVQATADKAKSSCVSCDCMRQGSPCDRRGV